MIRNTSIVCILALIALTQSQLNLNANQCKTQNYQNWDAIYCPISGGSGNYQYQYTNIPADWYTNKDRIYIPRLQIQINKNYNIKIIISDKDRGQNIIKNIVISYGYDNKINRFQQGQFYDDFNDRVNDQAGNNGRNSNRFDNRRTRGRFASDDNDISRNQVYVDANNNRIVTTQLPANFMNSFRPNQASPVINRNIRNTFIPDQRPSIVPTNYANTYIPYQKPQQQAPKQYFASQVVQNYQPRRSIDKDDRSQYNPYRDNRDNRDNRQNKDDKVTLQSGAFLNYLQQIFGPVPNDSLRSRLSGSVTLKKHSIFSPSWTKVYGIPFSAGYGNNRDLIQDNFSCTEYPINIQIFNGRIQQITKNVIKVISKSGDQYAVHLGGCTIIDSAYDNQFKQLPVRGQEIYFKGIQRKAFKNHYNGYHVTCY